MNFVPKERSRKTIKRLLEEANERDRKRMKKFVENYEVKRKD